jgi:peptide/nickel transport system substrate-binding protein
MAQDGGQTLTIGWWEDFVSLDPPQMRDSLATELAYKIYSTLVLLKSGTTDELVPDLAESWEISEDGLTYTFNLRKGVQWHRDYGEVTAEDVKYSLMRHKDEAVGSSFVSEASLIQDVEVVDTHTARVTMSAPYPGFLVEFAAYRPGFIVHQKAIEDAGDRYNEQPVGSGPFVFDVWSPGQGVDLVVNEAYYGETGPFTNISYVVIPEESSLEVALETGQIDIAYILAPEIQSRVAVNEKLSITSTIAPRTFYLQLNSEREPFNDPLVRQALWYAIDRETLVEAVMFGFGEVTDTLLNPHVFGRLEERVYQYDPERAKELLAEAGYADGFDASFLIYGDYGLPDVAAATQQMLKEVGINIEIDLREWAQHVEVRRSGSFDIALQPLLRLGPDQYVTPTMHSASIPYPNASRYSNPDMDALIEEARSTVDDEARKEIYIEIQRMAHVEAPVIPMYFPVFILATQPHIKGAVSGLLTINVTELTLES